MKKEIITIGILVTLALIIAKCETVKKVRDCLPVLQVLRDNVSKYVCDDKDGTCYQVIPHRKEPK